MGHKMRNMTDSELVRESEDSPFFLVSELGKRLHSNNHNERIHNNVDEIGRLLKKAPQTRFVIEALLLVEKIQDGNI